MLWVVALANHTYQHYYYAYRTLAAAAFALLALPALLPGALKGGRA